MWHVSKFQLLFNTPWEETPLFIYPSIKTLGCFHVGKIVTDYATAAHRLFTGLGQTPRIG